MQTLAHTWHTEFVNVNPTRVCIGQLNQHSMMTGLGYELTTRERQEYSGEWDWDKKSGYGVMQWSHDKRFEGHWLNGSIHGDGTMQYKDGSYYIGTWEKNKKEGYGLFVSKDGVLRLGLWHNGKFVQ